MAFTAPSGLASGREPAGIIRVDSKRYIGAFCGVSKERV